MAQGSVAPAHVCSFDKLVDMSVIGRGGFGQVFRAKHRDWGLVAYKELPNTYVSSHNSMKVLDQEVSVHRKLRHANIVTLMALVFEPLHKGIVMQFEEYGDVSHFLRDFPVEWPWKLHLTQDIVLGMNYLHTQPRPIIHGDLKAKNILIGSGYRAKIADFGLAFWKQLTQEVTQVNPGGTVSHVPPETWQNINGRRSEKYDVYGFAVLVWELLAFPKVPFHGVATSVISQTVVRGNRPPLTDIPSSVPSFLTGIVQDTWEQDPQRRPSFRALKDKIDGHVKLSEPDIKKSLIKLQKHESQRSCQQPVQHVRPPAKRPHVPTNPRPVQANDDTLRPHGIVAAAAAVPAAAAAGAAGVRNFGQHNVVVQSPTMLPQDARDRPTSTQPRQVQDGNSQTALAIQVQDGTSQSGMSAGSPPHTLRSDRAPADSIVRGAVPCQTFVTAHTPAGPTAGAPLPAGYAASARPPTTRAVINTLHSEVLTTRGYSVRDSQLTVSDENNSTSGLTGPLYDMNVNDGTQLTVRLHDTLRLDSPRVSAAVGAMSLQGNPAATQRPPISAPVDAVVSHSQVPASSLHQLLAVTSQHGVGVAVATDSQTRLKQDYNTVPPAASVTPAAAAASSCTCIAVQPEDPVSSTTLSVEVSDNTVSTGLLCAMNDLGRDRGVPCSNACYPAASMTPNSHEPLAAVNLNRSDNDNRPSSAHVPYPVQPSSAHVPYPVQVASRTLTSGSTTVPQVVDANSPTGTQRKQQQQQQ